MRRTIDHELWERKGGIRCRRCGRENGDGSLTPTFGSDACKGCAAGKILASNTGNINHLWQEYKHSNEEMAMMGFNLKKKGVIPGCAIDEERLYEGGGGLGSWQAGEEEARLWRKGGSRLPSEGGSIQSGS